MPRIWIYKRRFWWSAINPDEVLATIDSHTYKRAFTREGVIAKWRKEFRAARPEYDEVIIDD